MIEEKLSDFGEHPATKEFMDLILYKKDKITDPELDRAINTLYL
jgi:hypothetical protein